MAVQLAVVPDPMDTLTEDETDRLHELEGVIGAGLETFVQVGQALLEVRDSRLYRAEYGTFEEYCRERWGMGRAHVYRMMDGAEVAAILSPIGDTPTTESQARELAPLRDDPEEMREVWQEASKDGKPTAKKIKAARESRRWTCPHCSTKNKITDGDCGCGVYGLNASGGVIKIGNTRKKTPAQYNAGVPPKKKSQEEMDAEWNGKFRSLCNDADMTLTTIMTMATSAPKEWDVKMVHGNIRNIERALEEIRKVYKYSG